MTVEELLAVIPAGDEYSDVRDAIALIGRVFPDQLASMDAARVRGWVSEIAGGAGRNESEIRADIFEHIVTAPVIQQRLGVSAEEAERLIAGDQKFSDTTIPTDPPGTVAVGDTVIPAGAELVRVRDPEGSDAAELYFLTYEWNGVTLTYEVGDLARVEELFGGVDAFDTVQTYESQARFDHAGFVAAGSADQLYGSTESIESQFERETAALGLEDLPEWMKDDPAALALVATATAQRWSSGRLWTELAETEGFQARFGDVIAQYQEGGETVQAAVEAIVADEQTLRSAIRRFQPAGAEVTNEYLHQVMAQGWTGAAAAAVLEVAASMRANPDGLARANQILEASGLETLDEVGFMNAMAGTGPAEVMEALNTAQADRALREAGLEDVDTELLMQVVDTSDRLVTADSYRQLAQQLSFNLMANIREVDTERLGLSREDVIAAAFGEESPTGRSAGEVMNLLARFERDRQAASSGFGAGQAFLDDQGRLRIRGL